MLVFLAERVSHGIRWVCDVIMWRLQTRIKKVFSSSISLSYSSPNSANVKSIEDDFLLELHIHRNPVLHHPEYEL